MIDLMLQRVSPNFHHAAVSPHPEDARKWADDKVRSVLHLGLQRVVEHPTLINICLPLRLEIKRMIETIDP